MNYNRPIREVSSGVYGNTRFGARVNEHSYNRLKPNSKHPPQAKSFTKKTEADTAPKPEAQIIYGKYKGQGLQTSTSPNATIIKRKVREVLFSTLYRRMRFSRFLDLCSGCGAVGLEAISRGAALGTFVERSARMCSFIKKNMAAYGIKEGHGEVAQLEVLPFLQRMKKRHRVWDIVFFDPPPDSDHSEALKIFARGHLLKKERGILVVAHSVETASEERLGILRRFRVVHVPETGVALSFYENRDSAVR